MDLQSYLDRFNVRYQVTEHPLTYTAQSLARAEHVSGYQVIKPVLVEADGQMILVAVPACGRVDLEALRDDLEAADVRLVDEAALREGLGPEKVRVHWGQLTGKGTERGKGYKEYPKWRELRDKMDPKGVLLSEWQEKIL